MYRGFLACLLALATAPASAAMPRNPQAIYLEGEVLVRYRTAVSAQTAVAQKSLGLSVHRTHRDGRTQLLRLPAVTTVEAILPALRADPAIELAEPNFRRFARAVIPNDPLFGDQWGLHSTGQTNFATNDPALASIVGADMNLDQAWDANGDGIADRTGSRSVIVAVIDDAVQTTHPDYAANLVQGRDLVNNDNSPGPDDPEQGHGTSVMGCVGAIGNNGQGVAGVGWGLSLMPLKFGFEVESLLAAMDYARDNGAKVINMSFGGPGFSQIEQDKIKNLAANDILFVAAHGNDDSNTDLAQLNYPANYEAPNILSVAATNRQDNIASFSQYGPLTADVAAPGLQIVTTAVNSGYTTNPGTAGTSFSSPYAAGAAGLLRSHVSPTPGFREVRARLIESGGAVAGANAGARTSGGRIDVDAALDMAARPALVLKRFSLDGNGALDPGETTTVTVQVENLWLGASNVSASLSAGGGITVNSAAQNLGTLPNQGLATASFSISVPPGITDHRYVPFTVNLSADGGYSTQRPFLAEIGRLSDGVAVTQSFSDDLYDEYHAWHFDIPSTPSGTTTLVIRTSTPDNVDVDLLAKKDQPPQYSITVGINPEVDSGFFCTSGTAAGCQDPATLLSARLDGREAVTVENPTAGTYHLVLVNYAQQAVNYSLQASVQAGDLRPNDYSFAPQSSVAANSLVVSAPATIGGLSAPTFISVEPSAEAAYSINGGAFTSAEGTVSNGQQVRLRVRAAADAGAVTGARINIGGVEAAFDVQTAGGGTTTGSTTGGVIPGTPGGGGGGALALSLLALLLGLGRARARR